MSPRVTCAIVRADGTWEVARITPDWRRLSEIVGGYIEAVGLADGQGMMYVNEEGKLKNLPLNATATMLSAVFPHDVIVGDVVIFGPAGGATETDVTQAVIDRIASITVIDP